MNAGRATTRTRLCPCGSGKLVGPDDFVYADPCYVHEAEALAARVDAWRERERTRGVAKDPYRRWALDITPWIGNADDPDPARRMMFYLGVGHPYHLNDTPVPLFISATTLTRYKSRGEDFAVRRGSAPWAGDSGAYAALMLRANPDGHPWMFHPDEYGALWTRFLEDVGLPDFVGIQDWPCEEQCLLRVRSTVREHQEATLHNYLYLAEEFPFVPWLATLQGWEPWQYVEHFEMYERAGVDLRGRKVGIGSVCRRGSQRGIAAVFNTLAPLGMRMHGFGVSINGLRVAGHLLDSSDSQAGSATARRERIMLPGCEHWSRPDKVTGERTPTDCRNCFRYALHYREEVMDALRQGAMLNDLETAAAALKTAIGEAA